MHAYTTLNNVSIHKTTNIIMTLTQTSIAVTHTHTSNNHAISWGSITAFSKKAWQGVKAFSKKAGQEVKASAKAWHQTHTNNTATDPHYQTDI